MHMLRRWRVWAGLLGLVWLLGLWATFDLEIMMWGVAVLLPVVLCAVPRRKRQGNSDGAAP
jgi:low temperature requirement protein LtrA